MFDTMKTAHAIKSARIKKNMTQMNLADEMGVSYQAVSNWERGNSMPDISKLEDLSKELEIDMTDEDCETLSGLMVTEMGYIPMEGEKFSMTYKGCQLEIVEVKNKMIALARVTRLPEEESSEDEEEE